MKDRHSPCLAGKTALVTGGGNGIGREIARLFAMEGARIISVDKDGPGNAETARAIHEHGGACEPVAADVSRAQEVSLAFEVAGGVDILVNNAATCRGDGFLHEVSEPDWDQTIAACLKSVYLCTRAALAPMLARRAGAIVNISSVNALTGIHLAAYTAAKGAILSLTRLLALQYGPYGIRTNAICPGTIMTESTRLHYEERPRAKASLLALYPGSSFGEPSDIAECALYLASERSKFVNGGVIVADGGMSAVHRIDSLRAV